MVVLVENKLWEPIEPGTVTENNQMAVDGEDFGKVSDADKTYNSPQQKDERQNALSFQGFSSRMSCKLIALVSNKFLL